MSIPLVDEHNDGILPFPPSGEYNIIFGLTKANHTLIEGRVYSVILSTEYAVVPNSVRRLKFTPKDAAFKQFWKLFKEPKRLLNLSKQEGNLSSEGIVLRITRDAEGKLSFELMGSYYDVGAGDGAK